MFQAWGSDTAANTPVKHMAQANKSESAKKAPFPQPRDVLLLAKFQERTKQLTESVRANKSRIASGHKRFSAQQGSRILNEPPRLHNTGVVSRTLVKAQTPELFNDSNSRTRAQAALFGGASSRTMIGADVSTRLMYRTVAMDASQKIADGCKVDSTFQWVNRGFTTGIYGTARWPIKNDPRQSTVGRFNVGIKH
jgi:hypothetical protein